MLAGKIENDFVLLINSRLLDICHGQRRDKEMSLYLVFEHVHQDLSSYLEKCPPPGLPQDRIKVNTSPIFTVASKTIKLWNAIV